MKKTTRIKENTYAFIDSQNLNLGIRSQGWKLDFKRFRKYLLDKYNVSKAYLFIGFVPENQKLYTFLQNSGYVLVFKPTIDRWENGKRVSKGNVDAELVLHAMIEFPTYKKAIIVSGDGDFRCLIEYLEDEGKLLKVIVPNHKYSSLLREYAGKIVNASNFRKKVEGK